MALAVAGCGGSSAVADPSQAQLSPPSESGPTGTATTSASAMSGAMSPPTAGSGAPPSTTEIPAVRLAGSFDIGGGAKLYLECIGSGSPTILLEAGDAEVGDEAAGGLAWAPVLPELMGATRTCVYDRAGVGRSSPATGCRQLDDLLDDLEKLLAAADIDGPYLLAGSSGGGSSWPALRRGTRRSCRDGVR